MSRYDWRGISSAGLWFVAAFLFIALLEIISAIAGK